MSKSAAAATGAGLTTKVAVSVAAVAVAAAVGVTAYTLTRDPEPEGIGYDKQAVVVLDQDALQAAADEAQANAADGLIGLQYRNNAFSKDGKTFSCHIVNSASNAYDMFLTIFSDESMTDQIFLSGLVPPGSGFEEITLDKALEKGSHTVYVVLSQVTADDNGQQSIVHQVVHTMEFHTD